VTSHIIGAFIFALCTAGCDRQQPSSTTAPETPAALHADSIKVTLEQPARALVTKARNFDRANQLDSARIAYLEAAKQVPEIATGCTCGPPESRPTAAREKTCTRRSGPKWRGTGSR
jgi:hypothetical protein